ncbi:MAG: regulatory protein RecX [Alphaproteobacteria bacterium]|nr:regulatory protein RecX [Alphaproteobacteria bacterium]
MRYLERYGASRERLARVLERRARREADLAGSDPEAVAAAVAGVVAELAELGLVNDAAYAEGRSRALLRRGRSPARVRRELAEDGIDRATTDAVLAAQGDADALARACAVRFAKRRGIGPFGDPARRAARRDRDLRALLRQGFGFALARRIVDAEASDSLDDPLG